MQRNNVLVILLIISLAHVQITHPEQGLEDQIQPMACFSKKGHSHVHSFTFFLWLLLLLWQS